MLGDKIKELRKNNNMSQKALCDKSGVSISYIQQIEANKKNNPSIEILNSLADALNVNVDDLLRAPIQDNAENQWISMRNEEEIRELLSSNDMLAVKKEILKTLLKAAKFQYADEILAVSQPSDIDTFISTLLKSMDIQVKLDTNNIESNLNINFVLNSNRSKEGE